MLGIVAKKLGMTRLFDEKGMHVPVTLLLCGSGVVVDKRASDKNGYEAVIIAGKEVAEHRLNKAQQGFFKKQGMNKCYTDLKEFRINNSDQYSIGDVMSSAVFSVGELVDVQGNSIGKGFAGGMKRHGFGGLRASHGVSISHRSHGSTGQREDPGRVFKNKRMAGHMGSVKVSQQNLVVVGVDAERNLLFVKGSVPGAKNSVVYVKKAIKNHV